jgi:MoaA/NifB/PqqE/SkfB family radical SAM enzyme
MKTCWTTSSKLGIKVRRNPDYNYESIWFNLKTYRLGEGESKELPPTKAEFYDVALGTKCNANCPDCYASASQSGELFENICETWLRFISTMAPDIELNPKDDPVLKEILLDPIDISAPYDVLSLQVGARENYTLYHKIILTEKPTQIAIGSTGEPTIHPDFIKFLQTVFETEVVPNYTTNGIILGGKEEPTDLLDATEKWVGGVAVSFGNRALRNYAVKAIDRLQGVTKVVIHHIIKDKNSVDEVFKYAEDYGDKIHYHVLLPLMAHGRSKEGMKDDGTYQYLAERVEKTGIKNLAFGANFTPWMKKYPNLLPVYDYPQETYSKNILLKPEGIVITKSSFNLETVYAEVKKDND